MDNRMLFISKTDIGEITQWFFNWFNGPRSDIKQALSFSIVNKYVNFNQRNTNMITMKMDCMAGTVGHVRF